MLRFYLTKFDFLLYGSLFYRLVTITVLSTRKYQQSDVTQDLRTDRNAAGQTRSRGFAVTHVQCVL